MTTIATQIVNLMVDDVDIDRHKEKKSNFVDLLKDSTEKYDSEIGNLRGTVQELSNQLKASQRQKTTPRK